MDESSDSSDAELYKKAKMAAFELLSRREHSSLEIKRKLSRRSYLADVDLDALCDELVSDGWLNHSRFVESFIRARRNRGQGPIRIINELKQRGIQSEEYQDKITAYDDWNDLVYETLQRKTDRWDNEQKIQAKWQRFLLQRGFSYQSVRYALDQLKINTDL